MNTAQVYVSVSLYYGDTLLDTSRCLINSRKSTRMVVLWMRKIAENGADMHNINIDNVEGRPMLVYVKNRNGRYVKIDSEDRRIIWHHCKHVVKGYPQMRIIYMKGVIG